VIAVCLLTCDRADYTERTLRTFAAQNDTSRFRLLHADDASTDDRVPALAHAYGFQTVARSETRRGWLAMRIALFESAARQAEWILFLENDQEWLRAFPWAVFDYVRKQSNIYCLRLYGEYKDRGEQPCMTVHKQGSRLQPVKWRRLKYAPERTQVGLIHWGAQPSVTRALPLLELHRYGMESGDLTARVLQNVTVHIGAQRTTPSPLIEAPACSR
jgi:hypothetical protein